jgi:hypothetical protein
VNNETHIPTNFDLLPFVGQRYALQTDSGSISISVECPDHLTVRMHPTRHSHKRKDDSMTLDWIQETIERLRFLSSGP